MSFLTEGLSDTHTFLVHFSVLGGPGGLPAPGPPKVQHMIFINALARNALFRPCWPLGLPLASAVGGPSLEADLHFCAQARCFVILMLLHVILS